jgi:hypothetical protein
MICGSFSEPVPKYAWIVCTVSTVYNIYNSTLCGVWGLGKGVVGFSTSTLCV